jgi:serine/threonine protein kinase
MTQSNPIVIPGYRVERKLGQGGMATVYLAIQESFDREVALKIMSPFLNSDPSFTTRFVREARIVAQIHHASIVPVMDVGEHQTHHYLSMEYLPGGDLKHRIAEGKAGLSLAVNTCLAISAALDVAHRKGFVHRDIKPENILFREDGTPVLTDFGIARAIDAGTSLTMAGMMVGTPNYMSPEQVKGQELDGRSDLYSLGIVFYETLTGNVPFRADSTMSLALKHLSDPLPPLPPEFALYQPFIDRLTAKEREDRFASGAEVQRALRLINEMVPRSRPVLPQTQMPVLSPTLSMPVAHAQPQPTVQEEVYEQTLVTTRRAPTSTGTAAPTVDMAHVTAQPLPPVQPQSKVQPQPKVNPVRAPRPPSKLALALKAAGPAVGRSIANGARGAGAVIANGWVRLRSIRMPAKSRPTTAMPRGTLPGADQPIPADALPVGGAGPVLLVGVPTAPKATPAKPAPRGRLGTFTADPRRSRHAAWAGLVVAAVAFGFGTYYLSRPDAPQQQTVAVMPPAPAPVTPATAPILIPEAAQGLSAEELVALVQSIAQERAALSKVRVLVERAKRAEDRRLADERRAKDLLAAEERKKKEEAERIAREKDINRLLATVQNDYYDGRIYLPAGNSAIDHYLEIIKLSSGQPDAQAGVRRITEVMSAEIDRYLKAGRTTEGGALIARLRAVQPQNAQLAGFDTRLLTPVEPSNRERAKLVKNERDVKKANELLDKKTFSFRDMDSASDDYQDLAKASPETPGLETLRERIVIMIPGAAKAQWEDNNMKDAKRIVEMARKRNLGSDELQKLEATLTPDKR